MRSSRGLDDLGVSLGKTLAWIAEETDNMGVNSYRRLLYGMVAGDRQRCFSIDENHSCAVVYVTDP